MQDDAKVMYRFLCIVMAGSMTLVGCRKSPDAMEGEPLSEVLLRYTPQVGQTLEYRISINLNKKLFEKGRWLREGNERGQLAFSMTTVERTGEGYRTKFDAQWDRSNVSKETADVMKDKAEAAQSIHLIISDRYVWDKVGTHNLCLPEKPISPGDEWSGTVLFTFGDLITVEAPTLNVSYRLVKAVENEDGRYCLIECRPVTDRVEVPLQIGQLGLQCDTTGTVTAVREDCDAQGKIHVGDVLVAVNGHQAVTAKDWHVLYERFIEMPNDVGSAVVLTVKRDGQERDVEVMKTFATLGTMEVTFSKALRTVIFDIDQGVIASDKASPQYSVMYHLLDEFPFVDDYAGEGSFVGRAGTKIGPRVYYNQ
ncbi:MAG: hypothetical protein ACYTAS_14415, partial [Planctomycetota bacterium]